MVSKYRRLLQDDAHEATEKENGEVMKRRRDQKQKQKQQAGKRSQENSLRGADKNNDNDNDGDDVTFDDVREGGDENEVSTEVKGVQTPSASPPPPPPRRFGRVQEDDVDEKSPASILARNKKSNAGALSDRPVSRNHPKSTTDSQSSNNNNNNNSGEKGEERGGKKRGEAAVNHSPEDDDGEEEEAIEREGPRLYSCDACPHAVFTTHAALLSHAEERHADLIPDHARLRRVTEKLSGVWAQALQARRDVVSLWGKKVFAIAVQRDAGEEKMREAHRARAQLETVVRRWHEKARVYIFGSSVAMGVWDGMADIDFAVVDVEALDAGNWPPLERNAVRSITELLRRAGFSFVNLEPISHARVPIIKHHASAPILTVARRDAESVVARSVRFVLNAPASREDRVVLEGSVRDAVGPAGVQQVWWNRTGDVMSMTLDSTTTAIRAAICSPALLTPSLRAKVQPMHDECRPELYNIDFDLSFRAFGIRNSNLLRQYLISHPCARPGAIVLKDWSKTSGVNNSVNGYFTSYAINIMWIYYLIQKKYVPYVDPLDIPTSLLHEKNFDPVYTPMVDPQLTSDQLDALYQDCGNMLIGFFYFYSFEFDWEHHVISLNRPGVTTKKMLGWHVEDVVPPMSSGNNSSSNNNNNNSSTVKRHPTRYELCIEDPYEENLNLGRHIGITKSLRVRTELYRGLVSLLKDGEKESCVFASTDQAESADSAGTLSSKLPVRALFKLMALTTQAISENKQLSSSSNSNNATDMSAELTGNENMSSSRLTTSSSFPTTATITSPPAGGITGDGVPEKQLEKIFLEKAALEYQLTRKVWNWHQLIHRLGYKIHRGQVMPRRELGVRCIAKRDVDESPNDNNNNNNNNNNVSNRNPKIRGGDLTECILRDLSRGFMTLTPEWVAWSAPWASYHMRGYSRLTATAENSIPPTSASAARSSGEPAMGALRGTRRNAFPTRAGIMARIRTPPRHCIKRLLW